MSKIKDIKYHEYKIKECEYNIESNKDNIKFHEERIKELGDKK